MPIQLDTVELPPGCVERCPGCRHRTWSAARSEAQKYDYLARTLAPWAAKIQSLQTAPEDQRWSYRERLSLNAQWANNHWQFGLMRRDELIPIHDCPIHTPRANTVIKLLSSALPEPNAFPLAFYAQASAQATLVVKSAQPPPCNWLTPELGQALRAAGLQGLWLNCFPSAGKHLFHRNGWTLIWGEPSSQDANGCRYGPGAFQQLVNSLYNNAINTAQAFLNPGPQTAMLDLYCGHGTTLARWSQANSETMGVELSGEAVRFARLNAPKATILQGSCAQRLPQLEQWVKQHSQKRLLAYLNPPRSGLEDTVSDWLITQHPQRIAYLSCSAGTLQRDLTAFSQSGYEVTAIHPFDFFPQTHHVEALALMSRR